MYKFNYLAGQEDYTVDGNRIKQSNNLMPGVPCHEMPDGSKMGDCSNTTPETPINEMEMMPGMPCHKMGGMWMGNCAFDENGAVIQTETETPKEMHHESNFFSTKTEGLPHLQETQMVELNGKTKWK